jgi:hypothetical protein
MVVHLACENRSWGYDRIVGALTPLGYTISDQTIGNILKRHGIPSAPERTKTTTWKECICIHMAVLRATDFFTSAVWSWDQLVISFVFFRPARPAQASGIKALMKRVCHDLSSSHGQCSRGPVH